MATAASVVKKIDRVLNRVGPQRRSVYKRTVTRTGGDALIGRQTTTTTTDTLLSPQPVYGAQPTQEIVRTGVSQNVGDYTMLISPTAMSLSEIQNPDVFLVLKDAAGKEEKLRITGYVTQDFKGSSVAYQVSARSVSTQ
jgi:hypothetical protein